MMSLKLTSEEKEFLLSPAPLSTSQGKQKGVSKKKINQHLSIWLNTNSLMSFNYTKTGFASSKTANNVLITCVIILGFVSVLGVYSSITYNETDNEHINKDWYFCGESVQATSYKLTNTEYLTTETFLQFYSLFISNKDWKWFKWHLNQNNYVEALKSLHIWFLTLPALIIYCPTHRNQ